LACSTAGPRSASAASAALSSGTSTVPSVSLASAVTSTGEATRRVSAAFAVRRLVCAVSRASCALPTWITARSESDFVAAPARTRAPAAVSACRASSSWARAARIALVRGEHGVVLLLHVERHREALRDLARLGRVHVRPGGADVEEAAPAVEQVDAEREPVAVRPRLGRDDLRRPSLRVEARALAAAELAHPAQAHREIGEEGGVGGGHAGPVHALLPAGLHEHWRVAVREANRLLERDRPGAVAAGALGASALGAAGVACAPSAPLAAPSAASARPVIASAARGRRRARPSLTMLTMLTMLTAAASGLRASRP
jgi:hypothetical protein